VRDVRPVSQRFAEYFDKPTQMAVTAAVYCSLMVVYSHEIGAYTDLIAFTGWLFFRWAFNRPFNLPFRLPKYAGIPDPRNPPPGKGGAGKAEGILYVGNTSDKDNPDCGQEIWFTNNDVRTHILYIGTTGSGKTEGLKALVTNALAWGSGYVYVDGKADTDLWASLYAVARRFGRDDDLLVINYMTGNSDDGSLSNTMNPFSTGSSSYLANMVTGFMPEAGGDNAMWKERAVALMFSLMPALTYKRDHQGMLMDIGVVRDHIELQPIIRLSRDATMPERITLGLQGYLRTLPGYVDAAFDDEGNEKPPQPDQPMYDLQIARQQHGYLSMQFTRSLQMLADEYHYIFKAQLADVDVLDVVINRRILVTLIPALEKSGDEAANLGKIVANTLKGMMGATLGNQVEGAWEVAIGSKQTRSTSSFMTVFDEVGYYTAKGMAVMAAQARSLGFSLVFAAQDIPSMEKTIKQEARSITGNCNIKIFGRIEDPTDTKDFLTKHGGNFWALETSGMTARTDSLSGTFMSAPFTDNLQAGSVQLRQRVDYDHIRDQREGEITLFFAEWIARGKMFFVQPEKVKALRVHRFMPVPATTASTNARERAMNELISRLKDADWTAAEAVPAAAATTNEIAALVKGLALAKDPLQGGMLAVASLEGVAATKAAPMTREPEEFAEDAPKSAAAKKAAASSGSSTGAAKTEKVEVSGLSLAERINQKSSLPPLFEGDQFAFIEVEQVPLSEQIPQAGFVSSGSDFDLVTPTGGVDDSGNVMEVKLPENIAALIEESARKINKGLAGSEGRAR
jgi:intracellular multiplication protein IcmO